MESLKGKLLISSGGLYDPNFRHTVVLIGEHGPEGALGVILNRALNLTVEEVVPGLGGLVSPGEALYQGGPVQVESPVLLAEFERPDLADILVFDCVGFLTGDVPEEAQDGIVRARVYAGYAGWDGGQLEREMSEDAWIISDPEVGDVFTDEPDLLWSKVLRRKGPDFDQLSRVPYDPRMN